MCFFPILRYSILGFHCLMGTPRCFLKLFLKLRPKAKNLPVVHQRKIDSDGNKHPIIEFIKFPTDSLRAKQSRDQTERDWMARLNTLVPNGMNLAE